MDRFRLHVTGKGNGGATLDLPSSLGVLYESLLAVRVNLTACVWVYLSPSEPSVALAGARRFVPVSFLPRPLPLARHRLHSA